MKKFLLIAVSLGVILSIAACACLANSLFAGKGIKGSGNLITKTIAAPNFSGVKASRAVQVIITDKATDKITIEADDNLMQYVVVNTDEGDLQVTMDRELKNMPNAHITVTIPANGKIARLSASSAAKIRSEVLLVADEFELDASSAAMINTAIKARTCNADASSSAQIKATISAIKCNVNTSSSAKINADITAVDCSFSASSTSKIDAAVKTTNCRAETSSAANISLKGSADDCSIDCSSGSKFEAEPFVVNNYDVELSSGSHATVRCNGILNTDTSSGSSLRFTGDTKGGRNHNTNSRASRF